MHARYKDLAKVESAFRTIKTGMLGIRPVYVRKESRTRGHVVVTMLGYMIAQSQLYACSLEKSFFLWLFRLEILQEDPLQLIL